MLSDDDDADGSVVDSSGVKAVRLTPASAVNPHSDSHVPAPDSAESKSAASELGSPDPVMFLGFFLKLVVVPYVLNVSFCRVFNFSFECLVSIFVMMRYSRLELMADAGVAVNLQREILQLPAKQQMAMSVHVMRWLHDPFSFKRTLQI